jgi:pyruvate kinase
MRSALPDGRVELIKIFVRCHVSSSASPPGYSGQPLADLTRELHALRDSMCAFEARHAAALRKIAPTYQASARNLLHYLAMRRCDLRALQYQLAALGLSSLGRSESHALATVDAVLQTLAALSGGSVASPVGVGPCNMESGAALLETHTKALFGPEPRGRSVRIMVTMPSEAAMDAALVRRLVEGGMDCMRINCAHDTPEAWSRMIEHLQQARRASGRNCSILMDVAGPKLRTGPVEPGAAVQKVRPMRDEFGFVTAPARVWLTARGPSLAPPQSASAVLQVADEWLATLREGEEIELQDTRKRRRVMRVATRASGGAWAELADTAYFTNGTPLKRLTPQAAEPVTTEVSGIAAAAGAIELHAGDVLALTRAMAPGREAESDTAGQLKHSARIGCTLAEAFQFVHKGERVCFDEGKIVGVAESVSDSEIRVRIQRTPPQGARLRADKGINFPDSKLELPPLTAKDQVDLDFIVHHADLVGLSFTNRPADVAELVEQLHARGAAELGIVLKIETQRGFASLPKLLLAAMRHPRIGVMVARGDLAVECGYERLAEAQEEILWICEAAHCPAIWATQVLETLAKQGIPSRAEITDAAMGHRAECVMLNKGPHIEQALRVLDDILRRMEAHQSKKRAMLRALRLATGFEQSATASELVAH